MMGGGSLSRCFSGMTGTKLQFRERQAGVLGQSAASEQEGAGLHSQLLWRFLTLSPREEKGGSHWKV